MQELQKNMVRNLGKKPISKLKFLIISLEFHVAQVWLSLLDNEQMTLLQKHKNLIWV